MKGSPLNTLGSTQPQPAVGGADPAESTLRRRFAALLTPIWAATVSIALAVVCGSWGYFSVHREVGELPIASVAAATAVPQPPSERASAVVLRAQPAERSAVPPWPLWEYQLEEPMPAREPPLTSVNWRLLGATLSKGHWEIVVMRQGKQQPEYFKVGDKLPGGYVVREITEENVTLATGRRLIVLTYIGSR